MKKADLKDLAFEEVIERKEKIWREIAIYGRSMPFSYGVDYPKQGEYTYIIPTKKGLYTVSVETVASWLQVKAQGPRLVPGRDW